MSEQPIWSGKWWRFDQYEISGASTIKPTENARMEQYDPFAIYGASKRDKETPPPYQTLLALLTSLGAFYDEAAGNWKLEKGVGNDVPRLTKRDEDAIIEWCSRFGLLGILPQIVTTIEIPQKRMEREGKRRSARQRGSIVPMKLVRVDGAWNLSIEFQHRRRRGPRFWLDRFVSVDGWRAAMMSRAALIPDYAKPLIEGEMGSPRVFESVPLRAMCGHFFPEFFYEADNFQCPSPQSPEFWRIYEEPINLFLSYAMLFANAVEPFFVSRTNRNINLLRWLISPTGISLSFDAEFKYVEQRICPSLLCSFTQMALQDVSAGMRLLHCDCCRALYVTSAYQARYCSQRCAWKQRKRNSRDPGNSQDTISSINEKLMGYDEATRQ